MVQNRELLRELVEKGLEVAKKTGEFVVGQAPQLLQEFYMWNSAKHILGMVLGLFLLSIAWGVLISVSKKYKGEGKYYDEVVLFGRIGEGLSMIMPFSILSIAGIIILGLNVYNFIFITVAPELYLIEYFVK